MGQAQVLGAQVTYENPPEGGARATLDLTPGNDRPAPAASPSR